MSDYPPPRNALMVWKAGDQLMVRIPPTQGHDRGHIINFPFDTAGVQTLKMLLTERECGDAAIGHKASPTQDMADAWLRAMRAGVSTTKIPSKDKEAKRRERLAKQAQAKLDLDAFIDEFLGE